METPAPVTPAVRAQILEEAAKVAEGWPVEACGDTYQTSGNGEFWDAGNHYDQGRIDAAAAIRRLINGWEGPDGRAVRNPQHRASGRPGQAGGAARGKGTDRPIELAAERRSARSTI
jgi:hypothetical protein